MDGASVFILRCADGSLSVGSTRRSVDERVSEHDAGLTIGHRVTRRPVVLLHSEHHARIDEAVAAERRIKGWSRVKKIAYMAGEFEALRDLAVSRGRGCGPLVRPSTRALRALLGMRGVVEGKAERPFHIPSRSSS